LNKLTTNVTNKAAVQIMLFLDFMNTRKTKPFHN